ncbi:NTPase KAP family P-loop domain-containing protein 1 isoform X2 [Mugil cephalus]|uniref:NTPase KAP family P-loop domain-containing protein 1 isoform X2 n=1 Tax=Mugil cephalus TaxID=48193 RepID=UPI001FB7AA28|nr:NTPase KAP family P-loop domain-containing protein 1 isoform X2 [Mugil cephalus]
MQRPTEDVLSDEIYAYALSKTLTKVSSPATVGLYSSCQNRINIICRKMKEFMNKEASKLEDKHEEKPRPVNPSLGGLLALIGRMLFYRPIWTMEKPHNIRFIHVDFSAWHFAGSDLLWAGIAIRLFQSMQVNFGKLQLALYRVTQYDEEDEVKEKVFEKGKDHWRSKKICCCPLWLFFLIILIVPLTILVFVLKFDLLKPEEELADGEPKASSQTDVVGGLVFAAVGVPAASALKFAFMMIKNLIFSQEQNIKKGMDNERISSQLGFMNEVRREMWFISRFIQFMEVFERRKIRIVLNISSLDRCPPKKIVAVLEAINILLSEEESPFISILAVNPYVIVEKVNFADGCFSREDRAYALLNRIVTLAFSVPALCNSSKLDLFYSLVNRSRTAENSTENHGTDIPLEVVDVKETIPLIETLDVEDEEVESLVSSILKSSERKLNMYLSDDSMSMRRVINSIRVAATIIKASRKNVPQQDNIAAWVTLANQWPCRLSWIIQCVEDAQQEDAHDGTHADPIVPKSDPSKTLWKVFSETRAELYEMSAQIEDLLEQDEDPEMFESFLKVDFKFTIGDLKSCEVVMMNLDHSIRKELAQIRGTSRLRDFGCMKKLAALPMKTIINMGTEDICQEEFNTGHLSAFFFCPKTTHPYDFIGYDFPTVSPEQLSTANILWVGEVKLVPG